MIAPRTPVDDPADDTVQTPEPQKADTPQLGYGHRAHSPDPNATYVFEPGKPRVLPSDKAKRWSVPG